MSDPLNDIRQLLHYPAEVSSDRLTEAFTHRSHAAEKGLDYDNQRLEFLGDAVVELVLSDRLFSRYPHEDEGLLSRMRAALVCEASLAELARQLELGRYLRIGRGERDSGGASRASMLADLFEAMIGAYYLDCGYEAARGFLTDLYDRVWPDPRRLVESNNPKGELQELSQAKWGEHPVYTVLSVSGPEHQPVYEVEVSLHGYLASASAAGRRLAETAAARERLDHLRRTKVL